MNLAIRAGMVALLITFAVAGARAQGPNGPLSQAVRSYQNLDYETAADLLRRTASRPSALTDDQKVQAYSYLAASELYLGHREAAAAAFRQMIAADVTARPDPLVFPPEVQALFDETRRSVKLIQATIPKETDLRPGRTSLDFRVYTSAYQDVAIGLASGSGAVIRWIYTGPISDSLALSWDGRDAAGQPFTEGSYMLRVINRGTGGRALRTTEIPLDITRVVQDTVAVPRAPDASQYLPERSRNGLVANAAKGLLVGAAVLALPAVVGADSTIAGAPVLVGVAIGIAGAAGLLLHPGGAPIPANVAYNRRLNEAWRSRATSAKEENDRLQGDVRLVVRAGDPTVRDGGEQ